MRYLAVTLLLLRCATPAAEPPAPPAPQPPAPQPPATQAQEIYIDSVAAENPLIVKGRARTFENNVALRVLDAKGDLIVERFTTSAGEMGNHNPFEAQLWIVRDPGGRLTVEAFEYSAKDGSVRSLTRRSVNYTVEPTDVTLVFPAGDCTRLVPVTRRVPKTPSIARLLVEALIEGPTAAEKASGATSAVPRGSAVNSVNLRDGVLTVDLNDRLQNVGGSCATIAIRNSLTQTLQQLPTVKRVRITAAGSEELALQP